jgi:hypothetical protein
MKSTTAAWSFERIEWTSIGRSGRGGGRESIGTT